MDTETKHSNHLLVVGVLNRTQESQKRQLVEAYLHFWSQSKWHRGWGRTFIGRDDALVLVERAADIVVRIRSLLNPNHASSPVHEVSSNDHDNREDGDPHHIAEGAAGEFLWKLAELTSGPLLQQFTNENGEDGATRKFIRELVHATLSDSNDQYENEELLAKLVSDPSHTVSLSCDGLQSIPPLSPSPVVSSAAVASTTTTTTATATATTERARMAVDWLMDQLFAYEDQLVSDREGQSEHSRERGQVLAQRVSERSALTSLYLRNVLPSLLRSSSLDQRHAVVQDAEANALTDLLSSEETQQSLHRILDSLAVIHHECCELQRKHQSLLHTMMESLKQSNPTLLTDNDTSADDDTSSTTSADEADQPSSDTPSSQTTTMEVESKDSQPSLDETATPVPVESAATSIESDPIEVEDPSTGASDATTPTPEASSNEAAEATSTPLSSSSSGREGLRSSTGSAVRLEVQRVASDVERWRERVQRLQKLFDELDVQQLLDDPSEGKKVVHRLQKNCLQCAGNLMNELDVLDQLVVSASTRQLRKDQVVHIQALLDSVEAIKNRLLRFQETLEQREQEELQKQQQQQQQQQQEEASGSPSRSSESSEMEAPVSETEPSTADQQLAQQQRQPQQQQQQQQQKQQQRSDESVDARRVWRALKLEPRMEVRETARAYEIVARIPGMRTEDISLKVSDDAKTLIISGFRGPTPQEEHEMRQIIHQQRRQQRQYRHGRSPFWSQQDQYLDTDEDELLLRMGTGRYGSFTNKFGLPMGEVDIGNISASYDRGVLQVTVPKLQKPQAQHRPAQVPARQPARQQRPQQQGRTPGDRSSGFGFPGFFDDRDMWW